MFECDPCSVENGELIWCVCMDNKHDSQEPIDGDDHGYVLGGQTQRRDHQQQGDQARRRDRGSANGSSSGCEGNNDDLAQIELDRIHLCDEDGGHCLVQGRAVHVDCGAHGQHKSGHLRVQKWVL